MIERAAILGEGKRLDVARALGAAVVQPAPAIPETASTLATRSAVLPFEPSFPSLDHAMVRHIEAALARNAWPHRRGPRGPRPSSRSILTPCGRAFASWGSICERHARER